MSLMHEQEYPTGGTFVVPEKVKMVWRSEWATPWIRKEQMVVRGQILRMGNGETVAWIDPDEA